MSYISERVAYLNGLADGINLDEDARYGKLLRGIIDVLGAVSEELDFQNDTVEDLTESIDQISEDVEELEEAVFEEEDFECDGNCDECDEECDGFFEIVCPNCGETIYADMDMIDSEDGIICPSCNEIVDVRLCDGACDACEEPCEDAGLAEEE